jgi:hypothetical protein
MGCERQSGAGQSGIWTPEFTEVDLAAGAMAASVELEVEQYSNNIVGEWGMWKTFRQVLAELKKQQREVPLPPMHTVQNVP